MQAVCSSGDRGKTHGRGTGDAARRPGAPAAVPEATPIRFLPARVAVSEADRSASTNLTGGQNLTMKITCGCQGTGADAAQFPLRDEGYWLVPVQLAMCTSIQAVHLR